MIHYKNRQSLLNTNPLVTFGGWFLLVFGILTLFFSITESLTPAHKLSPEALPTELWFMFAWITVLLGGGVALINRGKNLTVVFRKFFFILPVLFLVLTVTTTIGQFNALTLVDQELQEQATNLRAAYQLRLELVPDLIRAAREPLAQEREIQLTLAESRKRFAEARGIDETIVTANQFENALRRLLFLAESYPQLRDTKEFQFAQQKMASTAELLNQERVKYNTRVKQYNLMVKSFPVSLFARLFSFAPHDYWDEIARFESKVYP